MASRNRKKKNNYRLGLRCEHCGGQRTDWSQRLCAPCRHFDISDSAPRAIPNVTLVPWTRLPNGDWMRVVGNPE